MHILGTDLKGQLPQSTVYREYHRQSVPNSLQRIFIENNLDMISMNTDPSNLLLYMDIL